MAKKELKPGRELDIKIYFEVFKNSGLVTYDSDPPMYPGIPFYSTDISAAWQVVEKMGWYKLGTCMGRKHQATFTNGKGNLYHEKAETLPHAICLAALKAIKYEK